MNRLHAYYDNVARHYSLNWAIALTVMFSFYSCIGFALLFKYFQHHDGFYLFNGPLNILLGLAGVFQGIQITHAVVRRLLSQATQPN